MAKLTKREDYQLLLDYILKVCGEAVQNASPVTPVALTGRYENESLKDLKVFDLQRVQSQERAAEFVKALAADEAYDFVAYVSGGHLQEVSEASDGMVSIQPRTLTAEQRETVVTMIYSEDCQAFAHHLVDPEAHKLIPGELVFVGEQHVQLRSAFVRATPTRH